MTRTVALQIANLAAIAAEADAQTMPWMGAEESDRLVAMGSQNRRRQFIAGHWLARVMASERTGTHPIDWLLITSSLGAPGLVRHDASAPHGLYLSLSHSGETVVVAIADFPIGVDLESPIRTRDWLALADHTFAPEECAQLRTVAAPEQQDVFHAYWTLKEANGKRDGTGLQPSRARKQCAVACDERDAVAISWQFDGLHLALVGERDMQINARGIPDTARRCTWRFETSAFAATA
ncbi:MAG: 4'-phosphopantetheinyl transferase superfamily protein [Lysobacteraceae bacterium]